ncbi:hypothetical protein KY285_032113 [Solanum tuberosum]|nr:hypothetical protein KY284_031153 [Solanum tuberosum]KAH0657231.1 hypothetical protein KY285_032113 [Solanum tuberosum]
MAVFAKPVHHHKNSIKDIRRKSNNEVLGAIIPNSVRNRIIRNNQPRFVAKMIGGKPWQNLSISSLRFGGLVPVWIVA